MKIILGRVITESEWSLHLGNCSSSLMLSPRAEMSASYFIKLSKFSVFFIPLSYLDNQTRSQQESWSHGLSRGLAEQPGCGARALVSCRFCSVGWCRERLSYILAQRKRSYLQSHSTVTGPETLTELSLGWPIYLVSALRGDVLIHSLFSEHICPFRFSAPIVSAQL